MVTERFDPEASDVDFLVDFKNDAPRGLAPYFDLKEALERIVGRHVDLVETSAVRNPYFARIAASAAVDVYTG